MDIWKNWLLNKTMRAMNKFKKLKLEYQYDFEIMHRIGRRIIIF